jgi:hypothetical protein
VNGMDKREAISYIRIKMIKALEIGEDSIF